MTTFRSRARQDSDQNELLIYANFLSIFGHSVSTQYAKSLERTHRQKSVLVTKDADG